MLEWMCSSVDRETRMFKRFIGYCRISVFVLLSIPSAQGAAAQDPYDTDPRHLFVREIKDQFESEISTCRLALRTPYHSVALVAFAKDKLETGRIAPSDPDWAKLICLVLLGYGYKPGIVDSSSPGNLRRPNASESAILERGYAIAYTYLQVRNEASTAEESQTFFMSLSAEHLSGHIAILNKIAKNVSAATHESVEKVMASKPYLRKFGTFEEFLSDAASQGLAAGQKALVVYAIEGLPKDKYIPEFLNAFETLSTGMDGSDKAEVISSLARVPVDQYQSFIEASQSLSVGRDVHDQAEIIRAMTKVPEDAYTVVCNTIKQIVPDIDRETTQFVMKLIGSIASVPAPKQTAAFINKCKQLSAGKSGEAMLSSIRNYAWDQR